MIIPVLVFVGLLLGGRAEARGYERSVAADLGTRLGGDRKRILIQSDLGPEALWGDVHAVKLLASNFTTPGLPIFVEPWRSTRGMLRELDVHLSDFVLNGLRVASLDASIPDCRFDFQLAVRKRVLRLSRSGTGSGAVRVTEEALRDFILAKFKGIKRATVSLANDKFSMDGTGQFGPITLDFYVVGHLLPDGGSRLALEDTSIMLNGQLTDSKAAQAFANKLNPVVDIDRDLNLHDAILIEKVMLRDGVITATGPAHIPASEN